MTLEIILVFAALPFVGLTLFFGTKGGFYDSDDYDGHGTAHKVLIDED
ncbi:putative NADH dehydrogenase subunit P [Prochlorococcus phage P-TIM68]|mgnify:FL=1|uniref:Putative NADH dehydrogenase subunit P n=1 Tax=Prochlorococcus phage P-TIM68 TaxID=1542477 RepID=A0A0K0KVK2_9CAUD|nr:putative NADH dehydrogenase subunit P [Prochlorococcus phage P-TIM68]AIR93506.1 putative NADH dehydrogenase subunit P [Prochlorococcus phage P-TIM68]